MPSNLSDPLERRQAQRDLLDFLPVGILVLEADGSVRYANGAAEHILGQEPLPLGMPDWNNPLASALQENGEPFGEFGWPLPRVLADGSPIRDQEMGILRADGSWIWLLMNADPLHLDEDRVEGVLLCFTNITRRRREQHFLQNQMFQDLLTELPNRSLFNDRLGQSLNRMERNQRPVAILFLDLNRFKVINDTLSHVMGDLLLVAVAERLKRCMRRQDTLARLGGDEFAVLFEDLAQMEDAFLVTDRIKQSMEQPFQLEGQELYINTAMGLAVSTNAQDQAADILRNAEVAMYKAKARGETGLEVFDPAMDVRCLERFYLESELRHTLEREELHLAYQPLISLQDGLVSGWEALIRWRHPKRGNISPVEFIPLAEETGLILPIGQWVLQEACRQAQEWILKQGGHYEISVNVSVRQFQQRDLVSKVAEVIQATGLDPTFLKLEITESVMMKEPRATSQLLHDLRKLGARLVIDDFGTGYSSLGYLKRFPVDTLKIDKTFVDELANDPQDIAIVGAIITLAKSLGMRVTAEGIETVEQARILKDLGCDLGQGYFFAKPLPPEAMLEFLAKPIVW